MHFTSPVHRPANERRSIFLQVTSGCHHNACRFCSYFRGVDFCVSPFEEVENDLEELEHLPRYYPKQRVFLQAADAFCLDSDHLLRIAELIDQHLPTVTSIGAYARVDDISEKSVEQLHALVDAGYQNLFIGIETGDDYLLKTMNKGFTSEDILRECGKLNEAGMTFTVSVVNGLGGHNYGSYSAIKTAHVLNEIQPLSIRPESLTILPNSPLAEEVRRGTFVEATERERLNELVVLLDNLECCTRFSATQATLPTRVFGNLPDDKEDLHNMLVEFAREADEDELRRHRLEVASMMMPEHALRDPMTPLLDTTKNSSFPSKHNLSWGRDFNPLA